jgi:hypothetical protein
MITTIYSCRTISAPRAFSLTFYITQRDGPSG